MQSSQLSYWSRFRLYAVSVVLFLVVGFIYGAAVNAGWDSSQSLLFFLLIGVGSAVALWKRGERTIIEQTRAAASDAVTKLVSISRDGAFSNAVFQTELLKIRPPTLQPNFYSGKSTFFVIDTARAA